MNLEQLQALSDSELNELSAVKVMGWETSLSWGGTDWIQGFVSMREKIRWNPTTDMNDAMELVGNYFFIFKWEGYHNNEWECKLVFDDPEDRRYYGYANTAPRAITIASILANGDIL